jgi:beta-galactosidase
MTRKPASSRGFTGTIFLFLKIFSAVFVLLLFNSPPVASGQPYTVPSSHRVDVNLDPGWRFIRQDVAGAQNAGFDDSTWSALNLPHTWNNLDGQDGGNNYYRGIGWYRTHVTLDASFTGRQVFLKFDGAFSVADIWLNGSYVGGHLGGFAAFAFDVTTNFNVGVDNVIAVRVNNAFNTNVPPLTADFTFFGGLYRDAHLLVTDPVQISPLDYGSPGVYLKTTSVSSNSAALQVTTVVSNATALTKAVSIRALLVDAATNIVTTLTNTASLPPGATNIVLSAVIPNPHLWNGLADPYLYQVFVEVRDGVNLVDVLGQPLGFRWFNVDPTNGFFLNGNYLDLHGVDMHQDWLRRGWAIGNAERQTNFALLKEIGATAVRLSHYEHADHTYQLADQNGIILWSEIPLINYITESPAFYTNAIQQLRELIRQRYNHPAVVCWGLFNEITLAGGPATTNLINQLAQVAAQEDPTRISTAAANSSDNDPTSLYSDIIAFNKYYGWYNGVITDFGPWADHFHATYPTRRVGISEYGAGASVWQHSENPVEPASGGPFHPEEYQNLFHESHWQQMKTRPFLWGKFIWNMFDFAVDGRNEGDTPGRNDKGLVTYDRQIRKDAFYWYKANWTTNPMVYITGHTFTNRLTNTITAKVYANCDSVELFLNGASQGTCASTNSIFLWPVTLLRGSNFVQAVGTKGVANVIDSLVWIGPTFPPNAAITSPTGPIVYLNSTNDTLQLTATASDNPLNPPEPLSTTWTQSSGPAGILLSDTNAIVTTARFGAEGIYGLTFTASNGVITSVPLTVVVNPKNAGANGLLAWWKMDESAGATAADSSGNARTATVGGAAFTTGYLSNALHFNSSGNAASFASPDTTQITVAAWVRADGQGNSPYPRIIDTPGYRLFFRFDGQGTNGFDFATYSTQNGDWFSGANTISTGAWYHVAASYDRGSFANVPTLYVNAVKLPPNLITEPSGIQPAYTGTGYLGNRAQLDRAWIGSIDDLRIYNRLLSDAEVQVLASMPPVNLAPIVNAGTNQTIIWPASVNLAGTVADDGKPNPPGAVTFNWSKNSGPGSVAFWNPNVLAGTASFSVPGTYVLHLTADDAQARTAADVTVTAVARPAISAQLVSGGVQFSWQTTGGNWHLQCQTNAPSQGLGTNWVDVSAASPFVLHIDPNAGSVYCRLVFTNQ